jgi:hypothetical protein
MTGQPNPSLIDQLQPYTWSDQETANYEAAIEAINELIGTYSARISAENAKTQPNQAAITEWRDAQARCATLQHELRAVDHVAVARVRAEYPAIVRRLRQTGQ